MSGFNVLSRRQLTDSRWLRLFATLLAMLPAARIPADDLASRLEPLIAAHQGQSLRETPDDPTDKPAADEEEDDGDSQVIPAGASRETGAKAPTADAALPALQPRDALAGLPFVSCRKWVVADANTGAVLASEGADDVVDVASTTKIMTAYVVLQLAQKSPLLLEQAVTFSERAAATSGSSCDLKAGEKLPVRELLHALLLPSGNDAAVALAEHFGKRFEPASSKSAGDSLSRFVAEMNRAAKRLEMSATRYLNPNGLPEKGHNSSARDLVRLTVAARKDRLFRAIVATRRHEVEVTAKDGQRRTLTWKSTNRLLAITGYSGVKTGYTRAAGSCLVSSGDRANDALIVVVLGASSAATAVADSRNLYRWGWRERGQRE
ncbi:MAG: D-alanyl-D-alanine carboxypeptidase [Planctomycetaceae bacterium]|nr:D-alanyl-D-alanine carboxypeptidase [Planctomycetaceae bacterium]